MTTAEGMERTLHLPAGLPGSGTRRYAAAMWLHAQGRITVRALEVFRVLAPRDDDDPWPLLAGEDIPPPPKRTPSGALADLVGDLIALLAGIDGEGIGETRSALVAATGAARVGTVSNIVVQTHLPAALIAVAQTQPALAVSLAQASPHLPWRTYDDYPAAQVGPRFGTSHAFASLIGEAPACWPSSKVDIGLFLMAPGLFYRDHAHPAPELYLPFTGPHGWRFRPNAPLVPRAAFDPVWNNPEVAHATKVGALPFLCLYAWLDHPQAPARIVTATDWERLEA